MKSLILATAVRFITPLMLALAGYITLRGHNAPGGGFIGGLIATAAVALYAMAFDVARARRLLWIAPKTLAASGLLLAVGSGLVSMFQGYAFMTGYWWVLPLGPLGALPMGTPMVFDLGVFLVVWGTASLMLFTLAEPESL